MTSVNYGPLRQIWFAPVADIADKFSFLIRDDTYSESSANLGRTLRLGDPIDTSAISAAYQTSWSGGRDQTVFSDTSMFFDGALDTTDLQGSAKFWPGFEQLALTGNNSEQFVDLTSAPQGTDYTSTPIFYGRGATLYVTQPASGATTAVYTVSGPASNITAVSPLEETPANANIQNIVVFGTEDGRVFYYNLDTAANGDISHTDPAQRAWVRSINVFGRKLVVAMGQTLFTRDNVGGANTWVTVRVFNQVSLIHSVAVSGASIYILATALGTRTHLYVSDGSSASLVYQFQGHSAAFGGKVLAHQGSIYIWTAKTSFLPDGSQTRRGALSVYDGSTVREIHNRTDNDYWKDGVTTDGTAGTWGKYVVTTFVLASEAVQTFNGVRTASCGMMLYDPVEDAFHVGPTISGLRNDTYINSMANNNGLLYVAFSSPLGGALTVLDRTSNAKDTGNFAGGVGDNNFNPFLVTKRRRLISSSINAGLPDKDKVWLRVNIKHNLVYNASAALTPTLKVFVKVGANYADTDATLIGTYTPVSGETGIRTSSFDINVSGAKFPRSPQLQYVLELSYPVGGSCIIANAIVYSASVEYMVPATSKSVWRFRTVCSDAQDRLDGVANSLTTATALQNKLIGFVQLGVPVYFWEPAIVGTVPSDGAATSVLLTDYNLNSFRVDNTAGTEIIREVSLTAYEIV